ncbi:MAG: LysR family transcriptional regulator [Geminicoccaceae bacterium]
MDPVDLQLFLRAAELRNLSQAGRELGLSPAVASKHLAALERQLGVTLLHRTTRRVTPTEQGQLFEEHAQRILAEMEEAREALGFSNDEPAGRLRVSAPAAFARRHISPAIAEFMQRYPGIELEVLLSDHLVDLQGDNIDVAIRVAPMRDSALIARKIAPSPRILCASPSYLERHGTPAHPRDLARHSCLAMSHSRVWVFADGDGEMAVPISGQLHSNSGDLIREAALIGLGIGIKSIWDVDDLIADGRLVRVLRDYPLKSSPDIWAVYQPRRHIPARIRSFVTFLAEHFGPRIEQAMKCAQIA